MWLQPELRLTGALQNWHLVVLILIHSSVCACPPLFCVTAHPRTRNPQPEALHPKPKARRPKPEIMHRKL